jgi:hypothetical protein
VSREGCAARELAGAEGFPRAARGG